MAILDENERASFRKRHSEWSVDGETIRRTFTHDDFATAMGFVTTVALMAEKADHHPDIDIRWNKVTLALTTHDEDGLTEKDTSLAAAIDARV